MPKAFLSHSSKDKSLVERVFQQVRAASAHYDVVTFQEGERTETEIAKALADTDLYVLFASEPALESKWVQGEIEIARKNLQEGTIQAVQVFVLDALQTSQLPEWIRSYIYSRRSNARLISQVIRSKLLDIALKSGTEKQLWVNRGNELKRIADAFAAIGSDAPNVLLLSGLDGIGRRSLSRRALSDSFGFLPKFFVEIVLDGEHSDVDFFRCLLDYATPQTAAGDVAKNVEEYQSSSVDARTEKLISALERISNAKQVTFLHAHSAILKENGALQDWIAQLVRSLSSGPLPKLVIISRRMVPPKERIPYERQVLFQYVESLSDEDALRLLGLLFNQYQLTVPEGLLKEIVSLVGGHPRHLEIAAKYASEMGLARITADKREFVELMRARTSTLIAKIPLTAEQERCLAVFSDYGCLSADDLLSAFDGPNDEEIRASVGYLQDVGLIERYGHYFQLPIYLADAISRIRWGVDTEKSLLDIRRRFADRLATLNSEDRVSLSTIDSGVLAALRAGTDISALWVGRSLLPSQYLRVAREFYNHADYARASELCARALERRAGLTREAQIEVLRIRGLASVRRGNADDLQACIKELEAFPETVAKRILNFLQGFKKRWEGRPDQAEPFFRRAYDLGGSNNFHVLRELAQVLMYQGRYHDAEPYARAAFKIADTNPYVIDNLLQILIETRKDDIHRFAQDADIQHLFAQLEKSAKQAGRSFYESRQAHYHAALRNFPVALSWADKAIEATPEFAPVYVNRADIRFAIGDYKGIEQDIAELERVLEKKKDYPGDKRHIFQRHRLRIRLLSETRKYLEAKQLLERHAGIPSNLHKALSRDLAYRILQDAKAEQQLRQWANQVIGKVGSA